MTARIISWEPGMSPEGSAVVAIGVFDGVHLGHQALLADTVADARKRGVEAIAVTFDRDPDQVVSPETAAPQLLTLSNKLAFISETGVDAILVIPFTHALAELCPEEFLESVLLRAVKPLAVHVGGDFRFGCRATGDVATLQRIGVEHGLAVCPHDLVKVGSSPVTSSRIRTLVAEGDVVAASALLGRASAVVGRVHRGRGEGASLGFATANVVPVEFAALPADGVYAGRAILPDGTPWAAAISVGTPPSFPEARDYLEAHLIGFEGDLYDEQITLVFFERLRAQGAYASTDELKAAIAQDVAASLQIAGFPVDGADERTDPNEAPFHDSLADGSPVVDDPAALEAAEQAVRSVDRQPRALSPEPLDGWKTIVRDIGYDKHRLGAVEYALSAAGIAAEWKPFSPTEAPLLKLFGLRETKFSLRVPQEDADAALVLIDEVDARGASADIS